MKIETLAEQFGLTYEQFESVAYTYWHETDAHRAAAACRAARKTSLELCTNDELNGFSATIFFFFYRNSLVSQTTPNNDASV